MTGIPRVIPRVLSIAGTDPTGGAGIQADLKSIAAHGGYGMAVVTALVAQNTHGVRAVHVPPVSFLREQLRAVSDDVQIDAVKIGMLGSAEIAAVVHEWLREARPPLVVLDPVMVATSGDRLLASDAEAAVRALCAEVDLVTPNLPELAVLVGADVATTWEAALAQARLFHESCGALVLVKGGHLAGADCPDALVGAGPVREFRTPRVDSRHTHGTGCSLSSAIATLRAGGARWEDALATAKTWLTGAIAAAGSLRVGSGSGPVDHFHALRPAATWTAAAWASTAAIRADVDSCAFVTGLRDGSLPQGAFRWYLAQDVLYLRAYAALLQTAAALAPTPDEAEFWRQSADGAEAEAENLHLARLGSVEVDAAPATTAYLDHLASAAGSYRELVAALLPCFWLYTDVGRRLAAAGSDRHPFADWLAAYSDPAFAAATARAIAIADQAAAGADDDERARMTRAFETAMAHELAFFEAPLLPAAVPR